MHVPRFRCFAQRAPSIEASLTCRRAADHARGRTLQRGPRGRAITAAAAVTFCAAAACSEVPGGDAGPETAASREKGADTAAFRHPTDSSAAVMPGDTSAAAGGASMTESADTFLTAPADSFLEGSELVWLEAGARGVTFRAIGQEPGWLVEFGPNDRLRILVDYGAREIALALAEPVVDSTTWVTTYRMRTEAHSVRVDIRDEPCADVMSGERFDATVLLVLDGVRYNGCGRTLTLP